MCRLKNCCCCLDLRTGCIFISVLLFIATIANTAVMDFRDNFNSDGYLAGFIVVTIAAIGFWIVLFIGALKRNTTMIGVSMIALIVYIVILGLLVMFIIIFGGIAVKNTSAEAIVYLVVIIIGWLAEIGLFVYFVLVIQSFRLEIIAGGSGSGLPYPN